METKELTNTLLKGKLTDAVVYRGNMADLNADNPTGLYGIDRNTTQNLPAGMYYGRILELNVNGMIIQFIFDWSHVTMTIRMVSTSDLSKWYTLFSNS